MEVKNKVMNDTERIEEKEAEDEDESCINWENDGEDVEEDEVTWRRRAKEMTTCEENVLQGAARLRRGYMYRYREGSEVGLEEAAREVVGEVREVEVVLSPPQGGRELLVQAKERVEELQGKTERFQVEREGLDQHINSLPDIPNLPSTDTGGAR